MPGGRRKLKRAEIHDLLTSLIDKSLVSVEDTPNGQRYRFLETVRDFLNETHGASVEAGKMRTRHREYYVGLTQELESKLTGATAPGTMDLLEIEHDNVRAAQDNSLAEDPGDALRIATSVARFWSVRGYWLEGIDRVSRALDATKAMPDSADTAGALSCMGRLLMLSGGYDRAERATSRALSIYEAKGDLPNVARSNQLLGVIASNQGDFQRAKHELEVALDSYEKLNMRSELPIVANSFGIAYAHSGDFRMAAEWFEKAIEYARAAGSKAVHNALNNIGIIRFGLCDYEKAAACCRESLQIAEEFGDRQAMANCNHILGAIAGSRGEYAEARRILTQSIAMADAVGFLTLACDGRMYLSMAVFEMGDVAEARSLLATALKGFLTTRKQLELVRCLMAGGMFYRDARLIAVADRLRSEEHVVPTEDDVRRFDSYRSRLRASLGDEGFDAAIRAGAEMSVDEAVALILDCR